jgi:septal ring factor EnvC (AmiA/AmiB activator)
MVQEQLEVLEERVQEMIELIKHLKKEKAGLEAKINQREKEFNQLQDERGKVRLRIEKLLGTLNLLDEEPIPVGKGSAIEE